MNSNGYVIAGTTIAVDMWDRKANPQAQLFFLTHFHSDHIVGLDSRWNKPIYTSNVTKQLLVGCLGISDSLVHGLDLNEEHIIPMDTVDEEMLSVTLFDANHCPGAVMFLFCGYFGRILHTGDFRYCQSMADTLHLPEIDLLYLDNTYCSPKCTFQKFEDALDTALHKAHLCLQSSKRLFVGVDNLGKEELLTKLAKETHTQIYAEGKKKQVLNILGYSNILTEHRNEAKIIAVPTNQLNRQNIANWNKEMPTSAILPTARYCGFNFKPFSGNSNIHVILMSNHSSFEELKAFVGMVHPKVVLPIIPRTARGIFGTDISSRADMTIFNELLDSTPIRPFDVPKTVSDMMKNNGIRPQQNMEHTQKVSPKKMAKTSHMKGVEFIDDEEASSSGSETFIGEELEANLEQRNRSQVWKIIQLTTRTGPQKPYF